MGELLRHGVTPSADPASVLRTAKTPPVRDRGTPSRPLPPRDYTAQPDLARGRPEPLGPPAESFQEALHTASEIPLRFAQLIPGASGPASAALAGGEAIRAAQGNGSWVPAILDAAFALEGPVRAGLRAIGPTRLTRAVAEGLAARPLTEAGPAADAPLRTELTGALPDLPVRPTMPAEEQTRNAILNTRRAARGPDAPTLRPEEQVRYVAEARARAKARAAPMDAHAYGRLEAERAMGTGLREANPYREGTPEFSDFESGFQSTYDPTKIGADLPEGVRVTPSGQLAVPPSVAADAAQATEETRMRAGVRDLLGNERGALGVPRNPQVDTPEFKGWFGESHVRTPEGEPAVVYHGSPDAGFSEFNTKRGAFFTDKPKLANQYTDQRGMWMSKGRNPGVYPTYLAIKNPLVIDAGGSRWDNIPVPWQKWEPKVFGNLPKNSVNSEQALAYAKAQGHDGIIIRNVKDSPWQGDRTVGTVYAVTDPTQIKSAIGNSGAFNPANPDIAGAGSTKYLTGTVGAGLGATAGAKNDPEHPVRGAVLGGLAGGAAGFAFGAAADRFGDSKVMDATRKFLAPATRTPEAAETGRIVRAQTGMAARDNEVAIKALTAFRDELGKLPESEHLAMIHAIETGAPQPNPKLTRAASALRKALDDARTEVQSLGTGKLDHFIQDYFPHVWEDPAQAQSVIGKLLGKRPLEGPKSFLKQRTIPTTADGIAAGLKPISTNPVDLTLLKLREMRRYVMGQRIMGEMKDAGLAKFVRAGDQAPQGYQRISDSVARVFGPPAETGGLTVRGEYWAPEPAASVINNYLSPGLRGNALFDAYQGVGNTLNQAQLGLSAFHLGFTSMDAITSKVALGMLELGRGKPLAAAKAMLEAPTAPISTYLKGGKLIKAYMAPGSAGPELERMADAIAQAGGRVKMDTFYKNNAVDGFLKALKEHRYPSAALRSIPAALETAARPIMEHVVPRQKLGVFFDLAQHELKSLPAGATPDQVREVMARAWDSVDNRMGQLVYDNLFWNKVTKDLAMASVRSVGWNLGTIRELGGGTADILRGRWTPRASYVVALPAATGMAGAVIHYLYTGTAPSELKDYFYPKTGRKDAEGNDERVVLPTYMKDVAAYAKHPVQTVGHKLHPLIAIVSEMLQNEDFYGDMIRNPDDPLVTQLQQSAEYMGKEVVPFGIRNMQESKQREQPLSVQLPAMVGLVPAKREDVRTDAQNKMREYLARRGQATLTPEGRDAQDRRREIEKGVREGRLHGRELSDSVNAGVITRRSAEGMIGRMDEPRSLDTFKSLTLPEAEKVFAMANAQEKALWGPALDAKRREASGQRPLRPVRPTRPTREMQLDRPVRP